MKKTILVLVAEHYSGKTTFSEIAQKLYPDDCSVYQARSIIEKSLKSQSIEITRKNIRDEGQRLSKILNEEGCDSLSASIMEQIKSSSRNLHIIDSVYHPHKIINWRKWCEQRNYQIIELAITISFEKRLLLAQKRHSDFSVEDLLNTDMLERTNDPQGQQIDECIIMATEKISNDSDYDEYISLITEFLKSNFKSYTL